MAIFNGNLVRVNTYTDGPQGSIGNPLSGTATVKTTELSDGRWVTIWVSQDQDGSGTGIYQQVYDADGTPSGPETRVNTNTPGNQVDGTITHLNDGKWIVTWRSVNNEIRHQVFNEDGTKSGAETLIGNGHNPTTEHMLNGGWITTWYSDGSIPHFRVYNPDGSVLVPDTVLVPGGGTPVAVPLQGGGFALSWVAWPGVMQVATFDADGNEIEDQTIENVTTQEMTPLDGGGFLITWLAGDVLHQQAFDANGDMIGSEGTVTGVFTAHSYAIIPRNDGEWTVVLGSGQLQFRDYNSDATPKGGTVTHNTWWTVVDAVELVSGETVVVMQDNHNSMFQQTFSAAGVSLGDPEPIYADTGTVSIFVSVNALDEGGWVVTWAGVNGGNPALDSDVYQQVFHINNNAPAGADNTVTVLEDASYVFSAADFGFSDVDGDAFESVVITSLPSVGTLLLDGLPVTAGSTVAVADISKLVWTPPADASGVDPLATMKFKVRDDGGTAYQGDDIDPSVNTVSFQVNNTNDAPVLANAIADQAATEDALFSFELPADVFADIDAGDILTYTASLSNGDPLPSWLVFDAATRIFSGTPDNGGVISVRVTATDSANLAVSDTFDITVANVNDAPVVANLIIDHAATEDVAFSFQVPGNAFADTDADDTLTYSATLANGSALPSWVNFDAASRTFSGTPGNGNIGMISVKVTATDGSSATASDIFDINVGNTNDAPVVANMIADQAATEDAAFSFQVPANAFADIDAGDALTYTASLADGGALPSWLSFDAATRTFAGTPTNGHVGAISVKVTATDSANAAVSDIFAITVANTNDGPVVAKVIADQVALEDSDFTFQLASDTFADMDVGDTLTYTATLGDGSALPSWLSFDVATRTFSGTPANGDVGSVSVKVTATDGSNASVSDTFDIAVGNVNDAPTGSAISRTILEDATYTFSEADFGFTDIENDDFAGINIVQLYGGELTLNGTAVTEGQFISVEDLDQLAWFAGADVSGSGPVFDFTVKDDGGIENGGNDTSASSYAVDFDVTSVLDRFIGTKRKDILTGTHEGDLLNGKNGNDWLYGAGGDDMLIGGKGVDHFVIDSNRPGDNTIRDFNAIGKKHDILDLSALESITSFLDLKQNHLGRNAFDGHLEITGGVGDNDIDTVTLMKVKMKHLDAGDFIF